MMQMKLAYNRYKMIDLSLQTFNSWLQVSNSPFSSADASHGVGIAVVIELKKIDQDVIRLGYLRQILMISLTAMQKCIV